MFYIRSNTKSKKVIKKNVLLDEGLNFIEGSNDDISLMYELPTGKGIKIMTTDESKEYDLLLESKGTRELLTTNKVLKNLYLDVKDLKLDPDFSGNILIRDTTYGIEFARFTKGRSLDSVIKDISIPLQHLAQNKSKKEDNIEETCNIVYLENTNTSFETENKSITSSEKESEESANKARKINSTTAGNNKFTSYNISGTLRSGSSVILSERIYDYKLALEKYNQAKEINSDNYNEICLNGYREDGSSSVRFKKTYEPNVLSYEYISSFVQDLSERLKLLSILEMDAKSAMAIEDKRYNASYHIMEACDMDFDNPQFRENMIKMKIAADKRRDMKKSVLLLSSINNVLSIPDNLTDSIENSINKIKIQSDEGIELYKDKCADDFIKEYEIDNNTITLGATAKSKLTVRPMITEGKLVAYEKHYK